MILFGMVLLFMASYFSNKVYKIAAFGRIAAILLPITVGSIVADVFENSEISFGIVIGSNILYLLVVTGINMMIDNKYKINENFIILLNYGIIIMIIILFLSGDYLLQLSAKNNYISQYDAIIILLLNVIFILYVIKVYKKENKKDIDIIVKNNKKEIIFMIFNVICSIIGSAIITKKIVMYSSMINMRQNIIGLCILPVVVNMPNIISMIIYNMKEVSSENKEKSIRNNCELYITAGILSTLGLGISSLINCLSITMYNIYDLIFICVSYIVVWGFYKLRNIKTKTIGCVMVSMFIVYIINVCTR